MNLKIDERKEKKSRKTKAVTVDDREWLDDEKDKFKEKLTKFGYNQKYIN